MPLEIYKIIVYLVKTLLKLAVLQFQTDPDQELISIIVYRHSRISNSHFKL